MLKFWAAPAESWTLPGQPEHGRVAAGDSSGMQSLLFAVPLGGKGRRDRLVPSSLWLDAFSGRIWGDYRSWPVRRKFGDQCRRAQMQVDPRRLLWELTVVRRPCGPFSKGSIDSRPLDPLWIRPEPVPRFLVRKTRRGRKSVACAFRGHAD
jgi:hypothetical protein